mmetsp:Transcript_6916/g.12252  ORF Transcript_6916/g.12252 Transcript_6916/m.12252 type:complete len:244 (+) Transcript_6916:677-1408(+)
MEIRVIILDKACEQARLSDARVADCNEFEFELSLCGCAFHLQHIQEEQLLADARFGILLLLSLLGQFVAHSAKHNQLVVENGGGVCSNVHLPLIQWPCPTHVGDVQYVKVTDARRRGPSEDKSPFANEIEAMEATFEWRGARHLHLRPGRSRYLVGEQEAGIGRWSSCGRTAEYEELILRSLDHFLAKSGWRCLARSSRRVPLIASHVQSVDVSKRRGIVGGTTTAVHNIDVIDNGSAVEESW